MNERNDNSESGKKKHTSDFHSGVLVKQRDVSGDHLHTGLINYCARITFWMNPISQPLHSHNRVKNNIDFEGWI